MKEGLVGLTKILGLDHANGRIRLNTVLLGLERALMLYHREKVWPGDPEDVIFQWRRVHPRGAVIELEEIPTLMLCVFSDNVKAVPVEAYRADPGLSVQAAI